MPIFVLWVQMRMIMLCAKCHFGGLCEFTFKDAFAFIPFYAGFRNKHILIDGKVFLFSSPIGCMGGVVPMSLAK